MPSWSTACPDWEQRITANPQRSLIPFAPLFPAEADAGLDIFRELRMVDAAGSPPMKDVVRQWVLDLVAALFGAYDAETGRRLIRYFFLLISKKNAKSTNAAGIMLTALLRNWRESGEYFILAPTKEIADNSFFPARDMIGADPNLRSLLHVQQHQRLITHRNTGATLKVVAADSETVGGKKTIGLFVDEVWLFGRRAGASSMLKEAMGGLASRPEGFVVYASTQSDSPPAGVFAELLDRFRAIRDGKITDPRSLPILYEFPPALLKNKAYRDRANWHVTNPNLGASVDAEFLADQLSAAELDGQAALNVILAKHLNVEIGLGLRADGWAGGLVWERGTDRTLTLDTLLQRCEVVTIGIDGGGLDDLLGIAVLGRERGTKRWLAWTHAFISDIGMDLRKANLEQYLAFEKDGDLTTFVYQEHADGEAANAANVAYVVDLVARVKDLGLLAQVGVDAAGIGAIVDALGTIGVTQDAETLDSVRQGIGLMGAFKTVEIKLADRSFRHGGQPMLGWCVGNAIAVPTPTAMRIARDASGYGKIDPLMALFNAAHLMSLNPQAPATSIYDDAKAYEEVYGAAAQPEPEPAAAAPPGQDWDQAVLDDMRHPAFAEHKRRFEAWQDATADEEW